jgi:hypothetical protein
MENRCVRIVHTAVLKFVVVSQASSVFRKRLLIVQNVCSIRTVIVTICEMTVLSPAKKIWKREQTA